jgi:hypothetical protein
METPGCECGRLDDLTVVPMGHHDEVFRTLQAVRKRGKPQWWLYASTCSACGETWLVAQEERHNDLFILRRLDAASTERLIRDGTWPPDFDRFETLLEIGRQAGHTVRFLDVTGSPLLHTVADLAKERPGIRVSELSSLLNLDPAVAADLARKVVSGWACRCFVCSPSRVLAEPGSLSITLDAE